MTDHELVRLLAERVLGWQYWDGQQDYDGFAVAIFTDWSGQVPMVGVDLYQGGSDDVTGHWDPLHNIADAWMLVDTLVGQGLLVEVWTDTYGSYARISSQRRSLRADTVPRAICRAALAAVQRQSSAPPSPAASPAAPSVPS